MSKDKIMERELHRLRSENTTLRKTVGRLRKRISKLEPDVDEEDFELKEPKKADKLDGCPECHAPLTSLTTPNKTVVYFCSKKCGYRKKS